MPVPDYWDPCYSVMLLSAFYFITVLLFYLKPVCTLPILFLNLKTLHICKTYLSILLDSHYCTINIIINIVSHFPNSGTLPQLYPSPSISCHPAAGLTDYRAAQDIPRSCRRIQPLQVSFPQGVCLSLSRQYP